MTCVCRAFLRLRRALRDCLSTLSGQLAAGRLPAYALPHGADGTVGHSAHRFALPGLYGARVLKKVSGACVLDGLPGSLNDRHRSARGDVQLKAPGCRARIELPLIGPESAVNSVISGNLLPLQGALARLLSFGS